MASGTWDETSLPVRPGLYINFKNAAAALIKGGARGIVGLPLMKFTAPIPSVVGPKQFHPIEDIGDAVTKFGIDNVKSIEFALQGGAKEVLVYTMPTTPVAADYIEMRDGFEARVFNVFVYDGLFDEAEQTAAQTWVKRNRDEGKHFFFVAGGDNASDLDPSVGDARSVKLADDYIINLINGVILNGVTYTSAKFAPFVAGLVAGTAINKSVTYRRLPVDDVTLRMKNSQIKTSLGKGSFVLFHDGEKVKVEQGLTTNKTKIRAISARMAVSTDVPATAAESYIGVLDNNPDGQASLIAAIKTYLERLEKSNVLMAPTVGLDSRFPSVGDEVYLEISYVEVDSMERIFLTILV